MISLSRMSLPAFAKQLAYTNIISPEQATGITENFQTIQDQFRSRNGAVLLQRDLKHKLNAALSFLCCKNPAKKQNPILTERILLIQKWSFKFSPYCR